MNAMEQLSMENMFTWSPSNTHSLAGVLWVNSNKNDDEDHEVVLEDRVPHLEEEEAEATNRRFYQGKNC